MMCSSAYNIKSDDVKQIKDKIAAFKTAWNSKDWGWIRSMYTDDCKVLMLNMDVRSGRDGKPKIITHEQLLLQAI